MPDVVNQAAADSADPAAPLAAAADSATVLAAAAAMFGETFPQAEKYAQLLAGTGVQRGVVGPAETDRIWDRHLLNCGAIARLIPAKCSLVDIGSGAGLPGIVLAILLPGARITLLEPMARRVDFLAESVAELGLANVEVVRGRAEDLAGRLAADVATARAVAPLDKLAVLSIGLLRPGGRVVAIKGAAADAELAKARPVLARLGVTDARVTQATGAGGGTATVVTFTAPLQHASAAGSQRIAARSPGRRPGAPGRPGQSAAAGGSRKTRPNSRRGGG